MNKYRNLNKDELIRLLLEKDDIIAKKEIEIRDLREKNEKLILKYENQQQRVLRDTYNKFVKTSEKLSKEEECINEAELKADVKKGRERGSKNFITELTPTRTIVNELDENERLCPSCGEVMVEIGEDRTKKIVKYPATYEVVEIITKKYACKNKNCDSTVKQAYNDDVFSHSPITAGIAADIINMKYNLAVPLDRYSKYLISQGINISTQCLSNYVLRSAELLLPLYNKLKDKLVHNNANVIHADETTLEVLDIKDREKCYMFVYTTSFFDEPVYLYEFSESRKTDKTEELLKGYRGYLVCDKYSGYNKFKEKLLGIQRCMAHARRYFYDVVKTLKPNELKNSKAKLVVERFDRIFKTEKMYKEKKYTISKIKELRNSEEYQRLVDELYNEIKAINPQPGSLLAKAVNYSLDAWDELFTYRKDGYLEMSNNIAERAVKPFVIARKNFLFSKTENGAQASGILFSIIQTAKANRLCVDKYLEYVLNNINKENIDKLLPWSESLPNNVKITIK